MATKGLLKYFPPPHFLSPPTAGLSISDQAVRTVRFRRTAKGLLPVTVGEQSLPEGLVAAGDIANEKELVPLLAKFRETHGLEYVAVSIPEEKAYVFRTEVPDVSDILIRNNLELRLEEFVPLAAREAVFDFTRIEGGESRPGFVTIGVAALPAKTVASFVNVLSAAGLLPLSLEIESQAVSQAVVPKRDHRTFLVLNVGIRATNVSIVHGNVVHFTSTIAIGGDTFTTAITKYFKVTPAEAEGIKEEGSFLKTKDNIDLFTSMVNTLSVLRDEINRVLVYWHEYQERSGSEQHTVIDTVLLCGRDAAINGFREYLTSAMKVNVEIANVWANAFSFDAYVPPVTFRESLSFAAPIGLALARPE